MPLQFLLTNSFGLEFPNFILKEILQYFYISSFIYVYIARKVDGVEFDNI